MVSRSHRIDYVISCNVGINQLISHTKEIYSLLLTWSLHDPHRRRENHEMEAKERRVESRCPWSRQEAHPSRVPFLQDIHHLCHVLVCLHCESLMSLKHGVLANMIQDVFLYGIIVPVIPFAL